MFMLQLRLCGCWTVLNLMQSHFSKGRQGGHRFNLGRGVCGVQVLLQNSLFWNWESSDDPLFNTEILRWVQGSGSSPTPSGKRVLLQNASCHLALQHSQVPQPLLCIQYSWGTWLVATSSLGIFSTGWAPSDWQGSRPPWRTKSTLSGSTSPRPAISRYVQSGASSCAKIGGAHFLDVTGSIQDPIAVPGPCEVTEF